jgi:hypothetical protein
MQRITYDEIWQSEQPWPEGRDVLGTIVRFQRGRAPVLVYTGPRTGTVGLQMPVFLDEQARLATTETVTPPRLWPVLRERCALALKLWHDFDVDEVLSWGKAQPVSDDTRRAFNARMQQVERDRATAGDRPLWTYVAEAFALDPGALPPLATARTARYWSAQVSAD